MSGPTPTAIDVYWRPGCPYCSSLLRSLRRSGIPTRLHNIWEDDHAAAAVRRVARGNETVPTVIVSGRPLVNPGIGAIRELLADVAPDLMPPSTGGRRWFRRR